MATAEGCARLVRIDDCWIDPTEVALLTPSHDGTRTYISTRGGVGHTVKSTVPDVAELLNQKRDHYAQPTAQVVMR